MQIIKIGKREYNVGTRKESAQIDCSLRAVDSSLHYHYCSFDSGYSLEELADQLVKEPSVVVFYAPRNNSIAVVFAFSDRKTKTIDLENKAVSEIVAALRWLAVSGSISGEIILATNIPESLQEEIDRQHLEYRHIVRSMLIDGSKKSGKMISSAKRNTIRVLSAGVIAIGLLSSSVLSTAASHLDDESALKNQEASALKNEIKKLGQLKVTLENASAQRLSGIDAGKDHSEQDFAEQFMSLQQAPASILVRNGGLVK